MLRVPLGIVFCTSANAFKKGGKLRFQRNDSKGEVEVCSRAATRAHALFNMLTQSQPRRARAAVGLLCVCGISVFLSLMSGRV